MIDLSKMQSVKSMLNIDLRIQDLLDFLRIYIKFGV